MGTHASAGTLTCYSTFNYIKKFKLCRTYLHEKQAFLCICEHAKRALLFARLRASAHGAENGCAAASGWTTTSKPPAADVNLGRKLPPQNRTCLIIEELIERAIYNCRFITLLAVVGSMSGSILCYIQGCRFVQKSFFDYVYASLHAKDTGHVVILLVEAIEVFLVATVMFIFGMGVYELFVNTIGSQRKADNSSRIPKKKYTGSNLFGLFRLQERPLWLEIRTLHDLKTKVGHVIVMILLVDMFEKSKIVTITTGSDLLCFSASILMSAGCLFLLSKLQLGK